MKRRSCSIERMIDTTFSLLFVVMDSNARNFTLVLVVLINLYFLLFFFHPPLDIKPRLPPPISPILLNRLSRKGRTDLPNNIIRTNTNRSTCTQVLVVTSWRSGSTLMGELLNSYPDSFYSYEPLSFAGVQRIYKRDGRLAESAQNVIQGLFHCNFSSVQEEYTKRSLRYETSAGGELITRNNFLRPHCNSHKLRSSICSSASFLNSLCQKSHFLIAKTVRLGLDLASEELVTNPELRIVYIARDPRGLVKSRMQREWCINVPRCIDPIHICHDLEQDFHVALRLRKQFPKRVLIMRYEEFAMDIWNKSTNLFRFLGKRVDDATQQYLVEHTKKEEFKDKPKVWNTFREPKETPFSWQQTLPFEQVNRIQEVCQAAMKLWGYRTAKTQTEVLSLQPLTNWLLHND